jgi:hypothetical protein
MAPLFPLLLPARYGVTELEMSMDVPKSRSSLDPDAIRPSAVRGKVGVDLN